VKKGKEEQKGKRKKEASQTQIEISRVHQLEGMEKGRSNLWKGRELGANKLRGASTKRSEQDATRYIITLPK